MGRVGRMRGLASVCCRRRTGRTARECGARVTDNSEFAIPVSYGRAQTSTAGARSHARARHSTRHAVHMIRSGTAHEGRHQNHGHYYNDYYYTATPRTREETKITDT